MLGTEYLSTHLLAKRPAIPFGLVLAINHQACWNICSHRFNEFFEMQLDGAPAFQIQMIEPVDALSRSLFVECSLEHGKRLGRMSHSAGSIDPRSDAEGHVARIRLGWIGASGLEQLLQTFVPRSGKFGETQPGESSCATEQRHAIGDRSDRRILTAPG